MGIRDISNIEDLHWYLEVSVILYQISVKRARASVRSSQLNNSVTAHNVDNCTVPSFRKFVHWERLAIFLLAFLVFRQVVTSVRLCSS